MDIIRIKFFAIDSNGNEIAKVYGYINVPIS